MIRHVFITGVLAAAFMGSGPSAAQSQQAENTATPAKPEKLVPIEKRLEADMMSMPNMVQALSKNLGQLHYLRTICFGEGDQTWRDQAQAMMTIEAADNAERRRTLIRAFNEGYYDQKARFSRCSDQVSVDAAALAENGRLLAAMLGDPYRE